MHALRLPGLGYLRYSSGSNLHGCEARPEAIFWYHGRQKPLDHSDFLVSDASRFDPDCLRGRPPSGSIVVAVVYSQLRERTTSS